LTRRHTLALLIHMGLTFVAALVVNPLSPRKRARVKLLVDSGAVYSVLPEATWRKLGLKAKRTVEFDLADGTSTSRGVGQAAFFLAGEDAISPVVLGGPKDALLLGAVTLESLGLMLNPLSRELLPMHMMLARIRS
jgi:predicted aspartyl protease